MKLCHTADIHIDEHNRFDETVELLDWMAEDMASWRPDLIVIAGDAAPVGVRASTPRERSALSDWYRSLAATAPVIIVRGNHDAAEHDIDIYEKLAAPHRIYAFSRPDLVIVPDGHGNDGAIVGALPWPAKGWLAAQDDATGLPDLDERCRYAMKNILLRLSLGAGLLPVRVEPVRLPKIFVGHLNVSGSDVGGFALIGTDVEVSAADLLACGFDYYALGHIHKFQKFGSRICYSGSPRRVDHGEEGEEKGYIRAIVQPDQEPDVTFRPTPIPPMQTILVDAGEFAVVTEPGQQFVASERVQQDADVRILIRINEEHRATFDEAKMREILRADRARRLKIEYRVVPKTRVRSAAMRDATTSGDRLVAYLATLDPAPSPETIARLLVKLELVG